MLKMQLIGLIGKAVNMLIKFSKAFCKTYAKSPEDIKIAFKKKLLVFKEDKFDRQLSNHRLNGDFSHIRSINITGDWRALFIEGEDIIDFILLGTHSNLY